MKTNKYILKLPAAPSVSSILNDYLRSSTNVCPEIADILLSTFDQALPVWCLHYIEKLQYDELTRRFPNHRLSDLYGLAHLFRFIGTLPKLFNKIGPDYVSFNHNVAVFINGFMSYLVEKNLRLDFVHYDHILPQYHEMTLYSIRNIQQGLGRI